MAIVVLSTLVGPRAAGAGGTSQPPAPYHNIHRPTADAITEKQRRFEFGGWL